MIITSALQILTGMLSTLLIWFPQVTSLNMFGVPIDDFLSTGFGYVSYLALYIPPIQIMLTGFVAILLWKVLLLILRSIHVIA